MKKGIFYIIGITLIVIIGILSFIFFNSSLKKEANLDIKEGIVTSAENKNIYGTFKTNSNWVKDPIIPDNVIEMAHNYAIVKVKINYIGEADFIKLTDPCPYTPVNVDVIEVIDGTMEKGTKTLYVEGGDVKVSNVLKTLNEAEKEKMELQDITQEDAENMYISYISDQDYKMELGKEYTLILSNRDNSIIMANGYGIFTEDTGASIQSKNTTRTFKNVITGKELNCKDKGEVY